jgi:hypothetical protein
MPTIGLGVDGASIVLRIREKNYTLTSPDVKVSTDGSPPRELPTIHFKYKEPFDAAIDIGTMEDVLYDMQDLLSSAPLPPAGTPRIPSADSLVKKWEDAANKLKDAPILGGALTNVLKTNVRIVEIGLDLTKKPDPDTTYEAKFRLGLTFAPHADHRPRLFNVEVVSFGAVLVLELEGPIGNLGTRKVGEV